MSSEGMMRTEHFVGYCLWAIREIAARRMIYKQEQNAKFRLKFLRGLLWDLGIDLKIILKWVLVRICFVKMWTDVKWLRTGYSCSHFEYLCWNYGFRKLVTWTHFHNRIRNFTFNLQFQRIMYIKLVFIVLNIH